MTKSICFLTICAFLVISCKVTEKDIPGLYKLDRFPKTTLKLNADKTFDFAKNNPNPYLHPFDHSDEYFSITKGTWKITDNQVISLTSQRDTLVYPLVKVLASPARDKNWSYFAFYDTYGDTVKILYVQYTDSSIKAALHRSMGYCMEDLTKRDTLEFHFYGYRPFTFISGQKMNHDYAFTIKPAFQPNFFVATEFRLKHNQLIDIKRKGRFKRTKSGM